LALSDRRNKDSLARRSISKLDPGRVKRKIPTSYCEAALRSAEPDISDWAQHFILIGDL